MSQRIDVLNVELAKFKEFIGKFSTLFAQENFNYNVIESQFEQLKARNVALRDENAALELKIKESLDVADKIKTDAREHERKVKMDMVLNYRKIQAKFGELENLFTNAEKRQIKEHLKEVEAAVA